MDDVRYSELLFLQTLAKSPELFCDPNGERSKAIGLSPIAYVEMAATLVEELYVRFYDDNAQLVVARLRGELVPNFPVPSGLGRYNWYNPRQALQQILNGSGLQKLCITFRGLRRIEELRDSLRRDRILDHFRVLLDRRYFDADLQGALTHPEASVSVIYADLDSFKPVNDNFGHDAGDVVLKAYLEVVKDSLGMFGHGYRVGGDETACLIVGLKHQRALEIAETIRTKVGIMECEHKGVKLPKVTTSIGLASTPPEKRTADIATLAEARNRKAKKAGKNVIVAE